MRIALVLGTATGGVGAHVRSLAAGLVSDGWDVLVCGPRPTEQLFGFTSVGARFAAVPITGIGHDPLAVRPLRHATAGADLVHAHGLRAGTVAVLSRRHPLVVTWHNAVLAGGREGEAARSRRAARGPRRGRHSRGARRTWSIASWRLGGRDVRFAPVAAEPIIAERSADEVRRELGRGRTVR